LRAILIARDARFSHETATRQDASINPIRGSAVLKNDAARAEAKARQAAKLAEIRKALVAAGYDTTAKQAAVLGVCRATAWVLLNRDKRTGPSAKVIKRILSSPQVPKKVRLKVEQYVEDKIRGRYGHSKQRTQSFGDQFQRLGKIKSNKKYPFRQMHPGETFKIDDADVRRAQKMAWYYRTRCKIRIVIAKSDDGYHCRRQWR
jgi:hypothetical protein